MLRFWLLSLSLVVCGTLRADKSVNSEAGIAAAKPESGPSVELGDGRFMVPYTERIPGTDIEFEMIPVPGGSFQFGSDDSDPNHQEDEGPIVSLKVEPMWVAKTEVRWDMYMEYMRMYTVFKDFESRGERVVDQSNVADAITAPTPLYDSTFTYEYGKDPNQPAVTMTQYAAQQFSKWLSRLTGTQYRLPTEAEWEYAARGGTTTAFSWGDDPADAEDHAWFFDNSDEGAGLVGTKKPNPFGLHDMHGNVAEWTVNEYTEDGYQWMVDDGISDASLAARWPELPWPVVARGGTWEDDPELIRSASRLPSDDDQWKDEDPNFPRSPWWFTSDPSRGVGFRLFRSAKPLGAPEIANYWEPTPEDTRLDVESRIEGGRGGYGLVDPLLPEAIEKLEEK